MLGQRMRYWPAITPPLGESIVLGDDCDGARDDNVS